MITKDEADRRLLDRLPTMYAVDDGELLPKDAA